MCFTFFSSIPSKDSGRKTSIQSSKDSLGSNNNIITAVEKTPNISNSSEVCISNLISPKSIHNKSGSKITNEIVDNEVACNVISNTGIKDAEADVVEEKEACKKVTSISPVNIEIKAYETMSLQFGSKITNGTVGEQICHEAACDTISNAGIKDAKADFATKQELCKMLTSVSPVKIVTDIVEEKVACKKISSISSVNIESNANETLNQQNNEILTLASPVKIEADVIVEAECKSMAPISPVNNEIKPYEIINQPDSEKLFLNKELNKTGITEQIVASELQKNLYSAKQLLNNSGVTENTKQSTLEVNNCEKQFNQVLNVRPSDRITVDKFLDDNDVSLLDSIDLNKIQLMKSDEDTDEGKYNLVFKIFVII